MAKYSMDRQDRIIAQFLHIARNAHRSNVESISEQLIRQAAERKAAAAKKKPTPPAPRYTGIYAAKYAAEGCL